MGEEALEFTLRLGTWMFEHPVTTGVIFTLALAASFAGGWWYENRRGGL